MDISDELKKNLKTYQGTGHLNRLGTYLKYELSSSTFYLFSFIYGPLLFAAIIAAIIFIPYMIYVLYIEKKYTWLIFFFLLVILPLILLEVFIGDPMIKLITRMIPIGLFFIYCIFLKYSVNDWIRERSFKRMWEAEKITKENERIF